MNPQNRHYGDPTNDTITAATVHQYCGKCCLQFNFYVKKLHEFISDMWNK